MQEFFVSQQTVTSEIPNLLSSLPFLGYELSGKSSLTWLLVNNNFHWKSASDTARMRNLCASL